jgi:uncharacterized RDD family membrane protein YckC
MKTKDIFSSLLAALALSGLLAASPATLAQDAAPAATAPDAAAPATTAAAPAETTAVPPTPAAAPTAPAAPSHPARPPHAAAPTPKVPPAATISATAPAAAAVPQPAAKKHEHKLNITITTDTKDAKSANSTTAKEDDDADEAADVHRIDKHAVVGIGRNSTLAAGEHADAVVSILGSSTSAGEVDDAVVSILGNTRVTGPVGDAAVAVLGNTYVDSHVGDNVVAVLGNVELGPHADVGGDVVAVGGELIRDPAAVVHGNVQDVALFGKMSGFEWLHSWVHHCLLLGRPLAFAAGIGWAWTLAFSFLALYLLIALVFPKNVIACVRTLETRPGRTVLASIFTFILKPIVFLLLVVTVIGMILVPFLAFALFIAGLFGKAVVLAWLGRRVLPAREDGSEHHAVLAVLVGGVIMLLIYVVPFLGFIAYKAFDILGVGTVVYTLILAMRANRAAKLPPPAATAPPAASSTGAASAAASAASPGVESFAAAADTPASGAPAAAPPPAAAAALPPVSLDLDNRAGFWIRLVALLLDFVLVGVVLSFVNMAHHEMPLILAAYGAVMWKLRGTTVGGIIFGLRIVRLDGRAIDWPTAIVRALGSILSAIVVGLGFIWVVFDPERQSWHDKIAGTVVVFAPKGSKLV